MNLSRRVIHSHQADQRLSISNLAKELKHDIRQELRFTSSAIEIETKATKSSLESHIATLQSQISQLALVIPQPSLRIGLEQGVPRALQDVSEHPPSSFHGCTKGIEPRDRRRQNPKAGRIRKEMLLQRSNYFTRNFVGTFHISSEIYRFAGIFDKDSEDLDESDFIRKTSIRIHPASWLIRFGMNFGAIFESQINAYDWKYRLDSFRAVPDDADIFGACLRGDIDAVKELFTLGKASIWDTDSNGWTPLHVRISFLYPCYANK